MFTGTYQNTLDNKYRMIIPAKYRDRLGGRCMLTRGFDRCLYIYSMEEWDTLVGKIRELKQSDRDVRKFIITKNLVTKGAMDKIEIWSAEVLDDPEGENMMDNEEFVRKLDMYNL